MSNEKVCPKCQGYGSVPYFDEDYGLVLEVPCRGCNSVGLQKLPANVRPIRREQVTAATEKAIEAIYRPGPQKKDEEE